MYAIIEVNGKQYWAKENQQIDIDYQDQYETGDTITEEVSVLFASKDNQVQIGQPYVSGAKVVLEVLGQVKDKKVIYFFKRRRKSSERRGGHRQKYTRVKVVEMAL